MSMELYDKEWEVFQIYDIFEHTRGKRQIEANRKRGNIPYFSASKSNNGLTDFMLNPKFTIKSNAIIYSTFGDAYYVDKNFSTSDEITILRNKNLNRENALFICQSLNQNKSKYSFGRKAFSNKIGRDKILFPLNKNNEIDWDYMEKYTKSKIESKLEKYKKYALEQLSSLHFKKIDNLEDKDWHEFFFTDIFHNIQRGKRLTKGNQIKGEIPYVSSSALNNGVDNYIGNTKNVRKFSNCISLANSGSVGAAFYHPYEFVASDHVTHLKHKYMDEYVYLFITTIVSRLSEKYNFNREINDKRISREKILLPVNKDGLPDYEYMSQYTINMKYKKLKQYLDYLERQKARELWFAKRGIKALYF